MAGRIDVDPAGLVVAVSFTTMSGAAVTAYSDAALSTPLTSPTSISNLATFYLPSDGPYLVSVTLGGVELGPFQRQSQGLGSPGVVHVAHKLTDLKQDVVLSAALQAVAGGATAGPAQLNSTFDIQAVGTTATDIPAQALAVPASTRPQLLTAKYELTAQSGTSASGSVLTAAVFITDGSNNILAVDEVSFTQVGAVNLVFTSKFYVELFLPGPVAGGTYKVRAKLLAAAPGSWSTCKIIPGYGAIGGAANNNFRAVTL